MTPAAIALEMERDAASRERFARLLGEHGPGLRRVARGYTRGAAEAADLEQDIALALFRALPSFRGECGERTFVYRVAHNRGISHAEARRARDRGEPLTDEIVLDAPSADEVLDAERRRDALFRAIAELPVGPKSVLLLALEGLSHDEIATVLGTTSNSVAVRLSRARADLRARLGGGR